MTQQDDVRTEGDSRGFSEDSYGIVAGELPEVTGGGTASSAGEDRLVVIPKVDWRRVFFALVEAEYIEAKKALGLWKSSELCNVPIDWKRESAPAVQELLRAAIDAKNLGEIMKYPALVDFLRNFSALDIFVMAQELDEGSQTDQTQAA